MYQESKKAQRLKESSGLRAKAPIAAQFEDCVQVFQRLSDSLQVDQFRSELERVSKECALRFKLWGESSGASSRALDYALKGSPLVKQQVLSLLGELNSTLIEALTGVLSQEPEDIDVGNAVETPITAGLPDSTKFKDEAIADDQDPDSSPELSLEEAKDIIGFLAQLLPVLRDPLDEITLTPSPDKNGHSVDDFKQLATLLFPQASKELIHRMGENNWRRWQSLRPSSSGENSLVEQATKGRPAKRTIPPWDRPIQRIGSYRRYKSDKHESIISDYDAETSTARSHMDTVLSRTALPDQDSNTSGTDAPLPSILQNLILPPPPFDFNTTGPFECPYCHFELPLAFSSGRMGTKEWSTHAYHDLKAYMCTFNDCPHEYKLFGDKKEWIQHEVNNHRSPLVWFCGLCRMDFEEESHLTDHIQLLHCELSSDHRAFIEKYGKHYSQKPLPEQQCVLCEVVCKNIDELESHLAYHQETFAVVALRYGEVRDEESIEGDERIVDYIAGLHEFQESTDKALLAGVQKQRDTSSDATSINTDNNRVEDTLDSSGLDGFENAPSNTELWNDKVKKFLNKQPTKDSSPVVRCNVRSRYENFVGRDVDLQNIRECLSTQGRICTVSGRGGIGKTATAVEYLHKFGSDYSYVFWVEAENPGQCADQYGMIAAELNLAEKPLADSNARTYLVKENLTKSEYRWLLIFDNVDSWRDISRYIPRHIHKTKGSILITTRSGPLLPIPPLHPAYHHQHAVELDVWPLEHGREFLLSSTQPNYSRENLKANGEYQLAAKVVEVVGRLPLAISMIVGYVKVSRCTLADFLEMWEEKEHIMKKTRRRRKVDMDEGDIDAAIDSLWTIGIREVRMNSRRLLDIISFLDPETIPKSFLVGDHKQDCLEFLNSSETLSYKRMINELIGRRLLTEKKTSTGETAYTIHRLLQHKILQDMEDYGFADAFRKAFLLIRNRFPDADVQQLPDPKKWSICQIYLPHISTLHTIYQQNATSGPFGDPEPVELANLFYEAGYHIWSRQSTAYDGLQYLKTAKKILDDINMDPNAKIRADILCVTGLFLLNMGCVERGQGFTLLYQALQIRRVIYAQFPEHNNDVLLQNAANDYALCLLNEHRFEEAGVTFKQCRARYLLWGPESENPFENSKYYGNYSVVLMWKGDMDKAIEFQKHSSMLIERFIGRKASYYRKVFMLACVLLQSGDLQAALDMHLEVLSARLDLLGKHDEFTISSMYAVGAMYHHLGDPVTATEYIQQSIEYAKISWWDRAALARAQYHLALLYREQNIQEDAATALEKQAQALLDDFGDHAAESVQASGDKMMILDDLQPTFLGRYTGRKLMKHLQEFHSQR